MNWFKRFACAASVALITLHAVPAAAQWEPNRPIRLILPYATGASTDLAIRTISDKLAAALGQPVVIDTRVGASGIIGTEAGAKAPPDGYTWIAASDIAFTILPHLQKVPYDPIKDFEPISLISNFPLVVVVRPDLPARNMQELVALARQKRLTLGTNGNGSSGHLASEQLKAAGKIDFTHVPYKGQPQVVTDLVGGRIDFAFSSVGTIKEFVKAGRLRAIAVTSPERIATMPDVPTTAEAGFAGVDMTVWIGLMGPAGTPEAVVQRVSSEIAKVLKSPEVRARMAGFEHTPASGSATAMRDRIVTDYAKWGKLIKDTNIKLE